MYIEGMRELARETQGTLHQRRQLWRGMGTKWVRNWDNWSYYAACEGNAPGAQYPFIKEYSLKHIRDCTTI